jgi:hypothetical protein
MVLANRQEQEHSFDIAQLVMPMNTVKEWSSVAYLKGGNNQPQSYSRS